ncbi:MAG: NrtA/SsuA/CpmA family ABC transporter substrate-binding protein [Magnetococcales bacterium]|nr:NrtA/SsuA/CpmA family ABC transporter substrate-binding protein [Magnetococcales bacterium]
MNTLNDPERFKRARAFLPGVLMLAVFLGTMLWREKPEKLILANVELPTLALLYLADIKGFLIDEGLEVTFKVYPVGREALDATLRGEADLATVFETPLVIKLLKREPLAILSTLHHSTRNTAMAARKDHGIHEVKDLIGKRIAVTLNTTGEFFLVSFLTSHGIPLDRVTLIDTKPDQMASVLRDGLVDAVSTWHPFLYRAADGLGEERITWLNSNVFTETSTLAGRRDILEAKQSALARLLKALLRAESFMTAHADEAIRLVIRRMGYPDEERAVAFFKDSFTPSVTLDNVLLTSMRQEAAWFVESGRFPGPIPDFRAALFPAVLEKVKPENITIL